MKIIGLQMPRNDIQKINQFKADPEFFLKECGAEYEDGISWLKIASSEAPELLQHIINPDGKLLVSEELLYETREIPSKALDTVCMLTGDRLNTGLSVLYRASNDISDVVYAVSNLAIVDKLNQVCPFSKMPITQFLPLADIPEKEVATLISNNHLTDDTKTLCIFFEKHKQLAYQVSDAKNESLKRTMQQMQLWVSMLEKSASRDILFKCLPSCTKLPNIICESLLLNAFILPSFISSDMCKNHEVYVNDTITKQYTAKHLFNNRDHNAVTLPSAFFLLATGNETSHSLLERILRARKDLIAHVNSTMLFQCTPSVRPDEAQPISAIYGLSQSAAGTRVLELIRIHNPNAFKQCSLETLTQQFKVHIELDTRLSVLLGLLSSKTSVQSLSTILNVNPILTNEFYQHIGLLIKNISPENSLSINAIIVFLLHNPGAQKIRQTIFEKNNLFDKQITNNPEEKQQAVNDRLKKIIGNIDFFPQLIKTPYYHCLLRMLLELSPECVNYLPASSEMITIDPAVGCTPFFLLSQSPDGAASLQLMLRYNHLKSSDFTAEVFNAITLIPAGATINSTNNFASLVLFQQGIDFVQSCCAKNPDIYKSLNFLHVATLSILCENKSGRQLMKKIIANNNKALDNISAELLFNIIFNLPVIGYQTSTFNAFINLCRDHEVHAALKTWVNKDPENIAINLLQLVLSETVVVLRTLNELNQTPTGKDILTILSSTSSVLKEYIDQLHLSPLAPLDENSKPSNTSENIDKYPANSLSNTHFLITDQTTNNNENLSVPENSDTPNSICPTNTNI